MTDTNTTSPAEPGKRKTLTIGTKKPTLSIKPKTTSTGEPEPVVRRKKKIIVTGNSEPAPAPASKPVEKGTDGPTRKPGRKPPYNGKPKSQKPKQPEKKVEPMNPSVIENAQKQAEYSTQLLKQAFKWLTTTFPIVFDSKNPKPLEINARKVIYEVYEETGGIEVHGFGRAVIKRALTSWTNMIQYKQAVAEPGAKRYGIRSQEPEKDIKPRHARNAAKDHTRLVSAAKNKLRAKRNAKQKAKGESARPRKGKPVNKPKQNAKVD